MSEETDGFRMDAIEKRIETHDRRLSDHDRRLSIQSERTAVMTIEFKSLSQDVMELVSALRETNKKIDRRLGVLAAAAWGLVLVLIPIAVALLTGGS